MIANGLATCCRDAVAQRRIRGRRLCRRPADQGRDRDRPAEIAVHKLEDLTQARSGVMPAWLLSRDRRGAALPRPGCCAGNRAALSVTIRSAEPRWPRPAHGCRPGRAARAAPRCPGALAAPPPLARRRAASAISASACAAPLGAQLERRRAPIPRGCAPTRAAVKAPPRHAQQHLAHHRGIEHAGVEQDLHSRKNSALR
jgi:hypothetical protein